MIPELAKKSCSNCKRDNRPGARFCIACGTSLNGFVSEEPQEIMPVEDPFDTCIDDETEKSSPLLRGRFRLLDKIHEDSHGKVSFAYDEKRERKVIVKEDFEYTADPDLMQISRDRFIRDGEILSMTSFKYIPRVIDVFFEGQKYFVVMKRVKGKSLNELMKNGKNYNTGLPLQQAIKIMLSLCDLVDLLHKNNPPIVHRNIKPSKVMINLEKKVVLLPWVPRGGKHGPLIGTKGFAAAEQYRGEYDTTSDIYGLGATFYAILTGKDPSSDAPFHFIPISILRPDITREVEMVITKSLQLQPESRYRKVTGFKEALFTAAMNLFNK